MILRGQNSIKNSVPISKYHRESKIRQNLQDNKDRAKKMVLRQFRYIKFIDQKQKGNCLLKEQPYPKHYL